MIPVTYTAHPRVTLKQSLNGPVLVHNRHAEASAAFGRLVAAVACLAGFLFLGAALNNSWRAGEIALPGPGVIALIVVIPLAGIVFMRIAARNRVEVAITGEWLQIRPRPFNLGRGQDIRREEIDRVQVEERFGYRIQFVDGEGFGLLPQNNSLSGFDTQDEATALAASVAGLLGLHFVPGVQPRATPSPLLGEEVAKPPAEKTEMPWVGPVDLDPRTVEGDIRTRPSKSGDLVTYRRSTGHRASLAIIGVVWLALCALATPWFLSGDTTFAESGDALQSIIFFFGLWLIGLGMLGSVLVSFEFRLEGDALAYRKRLASLPLPGGRIPLADLERIGVEVYWDSYNTMHRRAVAWPRSGEARILVDDIAEADGHALCLALHQHLRVPI